MTRPVASCSGGLANHHSPGFHPSRYTGFLRAVNRPRPLSPQGLCTCCPLCQQRFPLRCLQGPVPFYSEVSTQMQYHAVPSVTLLFRVATQPWHTFPYSASFFLKALSPCKIVYLFVYCLFPTLVQAPGGQGLRLQLSMPSNYSRPVLGTQQIFPK